MFRSNEPLGDGMFDEREQRIEIAVNIQEAAGFPMQAELTPCGYLEEFLPCSETARQRDECIRQARHHGLTFVHGRNDVQLAQAIVGDFLLDEGLRNHPDDASACLERRVGNNAHQPDIGAAVHDADAAHREQLPQLSCGVGIGRSRAGTRTGKDADIHATLSGLSCGTLVVMG